MSKTEQGEEVYGEVVELFAGVFREKLEEIFHECELLNRASALALAEELRRLADEVPDLYDEFKVEGDEE